MDLTEYRNSDLEQKRIRDLINLLPQHGGSVLDIGARDGYISNLLTEFFDLVDEPNGDLYLVLTATIEDPTYLARPFLTSGHFKKQADAAGWNPTSCSAR